MAVVKYLCNHADNVISQEHAGKESVETCLYYLFGAFLPSGISGFELECHGVRLRHCIDSVKPGWRREAKGVHGLHARMMDWYTDDALSWLTTCPDVLHVKHLALQHEISEYVVCSVLRFVRELNER